MLIKMISIRLRSGKEETIRVVAYDEKDFQVKIRCIMKERNAIAWSTISTSRSSRPPNAQSR